MNTRFLFIHALSPLHAGTGQGVGVIDLPIAREKATGLPFLPGSSLKGPLRDLCKDNDKRKRIFGPDTNPEEMAGAAQFSDVRLLLLPVRSLAGTFAWVTSPLVLRRLKRDAEDAEIKGLPGDIQFPNEENVKETCFVAQSGCCLTLERNQVSKVFLEDLDLTAKKVPEVDQWAQWIGKQVFPDANNPWQTMLKERLCIVHDDVLGFLLDTATEITARIVLKDDTKTVDNLWYEESLPAETILTGMVLATPVDKTGLSEEQIFNHLQTLIAKPVQFGGKATVGRGMCRVRMTDGSTTSTNSSSPDSETTQKAAPSPPKPATPPQTRPIAQPSHIPKTSEGIPPGFTNRFIQQLGKR